MLPMLKQAAIRIPVLCYHGNNIAGNDYATNDHVALQSDLTLIAELGLKVVPLSWITRWLTSGKDDKRLRNAVGLSFDDGTDLDFYDLPYPDFGWQRSFYFLMLEFLAQVGRDNQPWLHATSFVIASPAARADMDRACLFDKGWMRDVWWREADRTGLLGIENHSWDHNHADVSRVCQRDNRKGDFGLIDTYAECDAELRQAGEYIESKIGRRPGLFAYPFGQGSDYLRHEYLPGFQHEHGLQAAFSTEPGYVGQDTSPWWVPRFICARDWHDPDSLREILTGQWGGQ